MPQKQLIWRNILEFAKFVISLLLNTMYDMLYVVIGKNMFNESLTLRIYDTSR